MPDIICFSPANISDIPDILNLIKRSKSHFHPAKEDYVNRFMVIWGPNAYYIEDNLIFKAIVGDKLIGVIGMRVPTVKRVYPELDLLFVDSNFIGKGYGRLLWNEIIKISQNQGWRDFRFISDNISQVLGFYNHMGAKQVDEITLSTGSYPIMEFQI